MSQPNATSSPLLELGEDAVLKYLHETAQPDWETLKNHAAFSENWALLFLKRGRPISKHAIHDLFHDQQFRKSYRVCLALVRCRYTPLATSMNLLSVLRRYDLFMTLKQPYVSKRLQAKIEEMLLAAFPRLALGERIQMARNAPRGLMRQLRLNPDRTVVKALLTNYFFTYEDAMFLANHPRVHPPCLHELAVSPKWNHFREVKCSLLRNPRMPRSALTSLVKSLSEFDLRGALRDGRTPPAHRQAIQKQLMERFEKKGTHPRA